MNGCKADIEDLEDKARVQEEKIFGLEEAAVSQAERATYVEQLRGELGALNEQKQQSEARLKDEVDRNVTTVEELRALVNNRLEGLEDKASEQEAEIAQVRDTFQAAVAELSTEEELRALEALVKDHDRDIKQVIADLEKVPVDVERNVKDSVVSHVNDIRYYTQTVLGKKNWPRSRYIFPIFHSCSFYLMKVTCRRQDQHDG